MFALGIHVRREKKRNEERKIRRSMTLPPALAAAAPQKKSTAAAKPATAAAVAVPTSQNPSHLLKLAAEKTSRRQQVVKSFATKEKENLTRTPAATLLDAQAAVGGVATKIFSASDIDLPKSVNDADEKNVVACYANSTSNAQRRAANDAASKTVE